MLTATPHVMSDLLTLSHVPRWSIVPHIGHQFVADHSFRVAIILLELCQRLDFELDANGLIWALVHDGPEAWTGDISGPFKPPNSDAHVTPWWHNIKRSISPTTLALVKLCDLIEGATWISKWGVGHQAAHAARHVKGLALEKAREVAPLVGYGPGVMEPIVVKLIADIEDEIGRCATVPGATPPRR